MADYGYGANDFEGLDAGMGTYDMPNVTRSMESPAGGINGQPDNSGSFHDFPGGFASAPANGRSDLTNTINGIFGSNLSGADLASRAAVLGSGLAGAAGLFAPKVQKVGYQGGIPKYTAERNMVTAPPTKEQGYRPGQGGINYGGNVTYTPVAGASGGASSGGGDSGGGSGLGDIAKLVGGAGGAALLANYLNKSGGAAGIGGGISNILSGITGGMAGGARPSMPTGGARPGTPAGGGGSRGMGGGSSGQPTTPGGEPTDEFKGIDEQINANNMDALLPNLSDEEYQAELDRIYGEMPNYYDEPNPYMPTYEEFPTYDFPVDFDYTDYYFAKGGEVPRYLQGETDGMADKIPARIGEDQPAALSHGEFVVPADIVSHLGNGNSDAGAKKLYTMMDRIRKARTGTKKQGKKIDPDKFMPGGLAQAYANGGSVKHFAVGGATLPAGSTGQEQNIASWAGEYTTDMLGKGQALANAPYQQYGGPLTAGASGLQSKVFGGLQNTNFPGNLGQSFSSAGAPTPPPINTDAYQTQPIGTGPGTQPGATVAPQPSPIGGVQQPQGIASQYMNPYLQNVLNPQMEELRRQAQINNMSGLGALTKSGAFGGGRQAIMESEAGRNLLQEQNKAIGQGYASAFDRAQQQFNTEQNQGMGLASLMSTQGAQERGIEAEGIAADKAAFEQARENPYKMVQFQQSLLSGMPISATNYTMPEQDWLTKAAGGATTMDKLLGTLGLGTPAAAPAVVPPKK
jgi:hypothetical protein